jgi:hypothetical protein
MTAERESKGVFAMQLPDIIEGEIEITYDKAHDPGFPGHREYCRKTTGRKRE